SMSLSSFSSSSDVRTAG
ncbi:unnamed protein product, partial [Rotaria magnacalcarata]